MSYPITRQAVGDGKIEVAPGACVREEPVTTVDIGDLRVIEERLKNESKKG